MSFQAEVEHIWVDPDQLPPTLRGMFKHGACTVWADQEFIAAIPATNKQTHELADLMERWAVALDDDFSGAGKDYNVYVTQLCIPHGRKLWADLFKQEMEKQKAIEEDPEANKYRALASASRPRLLNGNH